MDRARKGYQTTLCYRLSPGTAIFRIALKALAGPKIFRPSVICRPLSLQRACSACASYNRRPHRKFSAKPKVKARAKNGIRPGTSADAALRPRRDAFLATTPRTKASSDKKGRVGILPGVPHAASPVSTGRRVSSYSSDTSPGSRHTDSSFRRAQLFCQRGFV